MMLQYLFVISALVLSGCSHLFLQPNKLDYAEKIRDKIQLEEGFIATSDGEKLHYWRIPAQVHKNKLLERKGVVVQVHGNAANLTNHVQGLGWITAAGYDLFVFDYRGYGKSSGSRDLGGAYRDVETALDYVERAPWRGDGPLIFYGQSLGGTLLLKNLSTHPGRWHPKAVVIEGSFYSYQQIAREKLAGAWLTWPFQWMVYLVITDKYSLKDTELGTISPTPVYLFQSEHDPIVPAHNADRIFAALSPPKELIKYPEFGHINAMWIKSGEYRAWLLKQLEGQPRDGK
ncbi:MAG: alpha/beta hydrolase [Bdellovibrionales bacterium]